MLIECNTTSELIEIVAGLVAKGLTFKAEPMDGGWKITLTGGY